MDDNFPHNFFGEHIFALDILLTFLHYIVIFLNIVAPLVAKLRKISIFTQALTAFSWVGLGLFYGLGYCPLTDIQWKIKRDLGESQPPASFIKYQIDHLFKTNSDAGWVDILTGLIFASAVIFNLFKIKKINQKLT